MCIRDRAIYEEPEAPDLSLDTDELSVSDCVDQIVDLLQEREFLTPLG